MSFKGLIPTILEGGHTTEYEPLTIGGLNELCKAMISHPRPEVKITISFQQHLYMLFMFGDIGKIMWFYTSTKRAYEYAEFTPFNKGCLYKVRQYGAYLKVYYGTKEIAHCTTPKDAYNFIIQRYGKENKGH